MEYKGTYASLHYGEYRLDAPLHNPHVRSPGEVLRYQARVLVRDSDGPLVRRDWVWNGWLLPWADRQARQYAVATELGHLCSHEHSPR